MKTIKRIFKFIAIAGAGLFLTIAIIFAILTQRDLNRADKIVKDRLSAQEPAPPKFAAAFDIAFPEESSHATYVGYLIAHNLSYINEQLNQVTTRVIAYPLRANLAQLLELDYHVHNVSRVEKINFVFNESRKVFPDFREWSLRTFNEDVNAISTCQNIFMLYGVLTRDTDFEKLRAKTDDAITRYLAGHDEKHRQDLNDCKDAYKNKFRANSMGQKKS